MRKTNIQHINKAFKRLKISGITANPSPRETEDALEMLVDMMYEFNTQIKTNYNFEENPSLGSDSGVDPSFNNAVDANLAVRLADYFGKEIPPSLGMVANQSLSNWFARTSNVRDIQAPRAMPIGSGNRRYNPYRRFTPQIPTNPISPSTVDILVGEANTFQYDFWNYLNTGETISSFSTDTQVGYTLNSSSLSGSAVIYSLTGDVASVTYLIINVITSTGRQLPQRININVNEV